MRIEVFTFCWNEMTVLPFAVDYWRRYADHVTVFDNGSTDGSIEFMQQHSDLITIEHWETNNQINDKMLLDTKNEVWKRARGSADLVVMANGKKNPGNTPRKKARVELVWNSFQSHRDVCLQGLP